MVGKLAHTPNQYKKKGDNIMKIGYIVQYDLKLNPYLTEPFRFREASCTKRLTSHGYRVYSKMLIRPVDYEDILDNANIMKRNPNLILVREPFLLDDELRDKVLKWVEWANKAKPEEYNPFYKESVSNE